MFNIKQGLSIKKDVKLGKLRNLDKINIIVLQIYISKNSLKNGFF